MKTFHCTHCQSLVFFENDRCLECGHALAYLPDRRVLAALDPAARGLWRYGGEDLQGDAYRPCANRARGVCNWAVRADDAEPLCVSCRLTRVIPNLSTPANQTAWFRLEQAKRRMIYTLLGLGLCWVSKEQNSASGLAFEFLENSTDGDAARVLTGHDNGLITVNIAEADDVYRERQRTQQHEPYRNLLGHFRHEIGHFYWNRLLASPPRLQAFRALFGDERANYQESLQKHYRNGPPEHWEQQFISAYASAHPWEDWAECWAHFLHMVDALETAGETGLTLRPRRADEPRLRPPEDPLGIPPEGFDGMIATWVSLTYVLNNLSRSLGLPDSYPFLLSAAVIQKLRFIHDTIKAASACGPDAQATRSSQVLPR